MSLTILLINLIPVLLKGIPGLSVKIKGLVSDVSATVAAIFASGVLSQPSVNTALAAWLGVINALKSDPNLPASSLAAVSELEKAVQSALNADVAAAQAVDWGKINAITPTA